MIYSILSILSILFSLVALTVGTAALAFVIGLKNSTHQVVWKPLESKPLDPFADEEEEEEQELYASNPNKRQPKIVNPHPSIPEEKEPFADLEDPSQTSNNW